MVAGGKAEEGPAKFVYEKCYEFHDAACWQHVATQTADTTSHCHFLFPSPETQKPHIFASPSDCPLWPVPSSSGLQSVVLSFAWQDLCSGVLGLIKSLYGTRALAHTQTQTQALTQTQTQLQNETHMRKFHYLCLKFAQPALHPAAAPSAFVAVHFVSKMILLLLPTTFGMQIVFRPDPLTSAIPSQPSSTGYWREIAYLCFMHFL